LVFRDRAELARFERICQAGDAAAEHKKIGLNRHENAFSLREGHTYSFIFHALFATSAAIDVSHNLLGTQL